MQSENSRGNSASGDADSPCSLRETSPRKMMDLVALTGPFGDNFSLKEISSTEMLFKAQASNSSTDSEDSDPDILKIEYLQRLALIREQMATLDIANIDYYPSCFNSSYFPNQCTITELHDSDNETNTCSPRTTDAIEVEDNIRDPEENNENECLIDDFKDGKTMNLNTNETEEKTNPNALLIEELAKKISEVEIENIMHRNDPNTSMPEDVIKVSAEPGPELEIKPFENDPDATEENINQSDVIIEESAEKLSEMEVKSVLSFENVYKSESPSELMELNYNPPKKKPCIRDSTPRMYIFDSASNMPENNVFKFRNGSQEHKDSNLLPKIKSECTCGMKPVETIDVSCGHEYGDLEHISPNLANRDDLYVKFLDTTENSPSSRSYQSDITEGITTVESPRNKSYKRRLFLRSASNKVKPIDKMTLWEEIRTMEAIKNKNAPKVSNSQESFFKKILIRKPNPILPIDLEAIGSLDIPRKSTRSRRFPSITKISKFCSSLFSKRSESVVEEESEAKKVSKAVQTGNSHKTTHHNKELFPKVAKTLLDVRKEERITLDSHTPSYEEHSDYSYQEDDLEAYFQHKCFFCFCF
ncbi:unnamed protein product [Ceutorhynchus assimilis]|uniref:Uncharacterized protein n=1 Tax=Ceutorhynchus assimilis TaxID=467358 RepID=A0A9N9MT89_9CUCU|nr:unnamed protein product [Ceutorhynchus assimilis]